MLSEANCATVYRLPGQASGIVKVERRCPFMRSMPFCRG